MSENTPISELAPTKVPSSDQRVWQAFVDQNKGRDVELATVGLYVAVRKPIRDCVETDLDYYHLILAQFLNARIAARRLKIARAYWEFANSLEQDLLEMYEQSLQAEAEYLSQQSEVVS